MVSVAASLRYKESMLVGPGGSLLVWRLLVSWVPFCLYPALSLGRMLHLWTNEGGGTAGRCGWHHLVPKLALIRDSESMLHPGHQNQKVRVGQQSASTRPLVPHGSRLTATVHENAPVNVLNSHSFLYPVGCHSACPLFQRSVSTFFFLFFKKT